MQTYRLFVGMLPPEPTQLAIERQRCSWRLPSGAIPTRRHRLHLTLHFLGDVELARAFEVRDALSDVAMEETTLVLNQPASWGAAVVRPVENEALRALHARIAEPLRRLGLPVAAHWTPHVTIAHNAHGAVPPDTLEPVSWQAREFALIWSRFEPRGQYDVLARYPTP